MKLFTHNVLTSKVIKTVQVGYPLMLTSTEALTVTQEFKPTLVSLLIRRVNWPVLVEAAASVGLGKPLPSNVPEDYEHNVEFLREAHHALFEIEVITGELECPETGRKFQIQNGIPSMFIDEDEV